MEKNRQPRKQISVEGEPLQGHFLLAQCCHMRGNTLLLCFSHFMILDLFHKAVSPF